MGGWGLDENPYRPNRQTGLQSGPSYANTLSYVFVQCNSCDRYSVGSGMKQCICGDVMWTTQYFEPLKLSVKTSD